MLESKNTLLGVRNLRTTLLSHLFGLQLPDQTDVVQSVLSLGYLRSASNNDYWFRSESNNAPPNSFQIKFTADRNLATPNILPANSGLSFLPQKIAGRISCERSRFSAAGFSCFPHGVMPR